MLLIVFYDFFFFNDTATTEIYTRPYTLSLHDALPISGLAAADARRGAAGRAGRLAANRRARRAGLRVSHRAARERGAAAPTAAEPRGKGMGSSRPPARARRVPGGARRASQRGRCLVQRGYRGIGRLGRRDGAGESRARRRIARSRPAVPRVVQSRAARPAPGR